MSPQMAVEQRDAGTHSAVGMVCAMFSRIQPREQAGVARQGPRRGRDHPVEDRGSPCQIVDRRSSRARVPVASEPIGTRGINDDKDDIQLCRALHQMPPKGLRPQAAVNEARDGFQQALFRRRQAKTPAAADTLAVNAGLFKSSEIRMRGRANQSGSRSTIPSRVAAANLKPSDATRFFVASVWAPRGYAKDSTAAPKRSSRKRFEPSISR